MNHNPWNSEAPPKSQGFYEVRFLDPNAPPQNGPDVVSGIQQSIAEWRERDKKVGKVWWIHVSEDPTKEKKPERLVAKVLNWRKASKEQVQAHLARKLTAEERIAKVYENFRRVRDLSISGDNPIPNWHTPISPPPSRKLEIGMSVDNNRACLGKVVALFEDGQVAVVDRGASLEPQNKTSDELSVFHWLDIVPTALNDTLAPSTHESTPFSDSYRTSSISSLIHLITNQGAVSDMDFQRDYVWTLADKENYIDSLLKGRDVGRFIVVAMNCDTGAPPQIVDGKQRLNAVIEFMASTYAYNGLFWHELSYQDRRHLLGRNVQFLMVEPERASRVMILKLFLLANSAGVPQTKEHLSHVQALYDAELAKPGVAESVRSFYAA